eukprot:COSAG05_NODE_7711_length_777_cov_1.141593_1_plen_188_part_01
MPAVDTAAAAGLAESHKERARKVSELSALRLSDLRKRAVGAGLDSIAIDAAVDSGDAKGQLATLLMGVIPASTASKEPNSGRSELKSELMAKQALIEVLVETGAPSPPSATATLGAAAEARTEKRAALQAELKGLRISALQKRAEKDGVDVVEIDDALESDNAKEELIRLIVAVNLTKDEKANAVAAA